MPKYDIPYFRFIALVLLIILAYIQTRYYKITDSQLLKNDSDDSFVYNKIDKEDYKVVRKSTFFPLPLINRSAPESEISWAENFLKMPTWSNGYHRCDSKDSEVSCYELSRAARLIEQWENNSIQKRHIGKVIVKVTKAPFIERLTMLYHGLQIAISTNRDLYTDRNLFLPIELPSVIMQRTGRESGKGLPSDHYVCCCDVSPRYPNVFINGYSWPQAFYVHHDIAPFLRGNFGYHAAYFLGNYLFGNSTKPPNKCFHDTTSTIIEGYQSQGTDSELKPCNFFYTLPRCGIDPSQASMIANENCSQKHFKETFWYNVDDPNQNVCALRKLTSAKRIVQTFGSRLGFWATALQGSKGSFVNTVDKICVNMTNSQQGSLWHTYCPNNKKDVFKTNSYFFICGPNAEDGRLYLDYLLW